MGGVGIPQSGPRPINEEEVSGGEEAEGAAGVHGDAVSGGPDSGGAAGVDDGGDEGIRGGLEREETEGEGVVWRRP